MRSDFQPLKIHYIYRSNNHPPFSGASFPASTQYAPIAVTNHASSPATYPYNQPPYGGMPQFSTDYHSPPAQRLNMPNGYSGVPEV